MSDWTSFGLRESGGLSGRARIEELPPLLADLVGLGQRRSIEPVVGITTDGTVRSGLYELGPTGQSTAAVTDAAMNLLSLLAEDQRQRLVFPLGSAEQRLWFNIHPNVLRHGLLLEDLPADTRQAALGIVQASLSDRGFQQARDIMRINGLLVALTDRPDEFGEWPYWFSLFGSPSSDEPWGWQIDGHHLNLNCLVLGDRLVITPSFMGSEPCHIHHGPLAGTAVLVLEERSGLDLIRSFDDRQLAEAVLYDSIEPGHLPKELQHPIDGRMVAGAFQDNATIACQGVRGDGMSDAQQRLLRQLIGSYVGWADDGHAGVQMTEVSEHLDETYFCWMGSRSDDGPFYYRVQSPVVLIEFDHHPGIVFDNPVPSRNHIHSILRAPNGGDYGVDLLSQHYERYDHAHGDHRPHPH
ncbi:MAG: DUF3500 domain-containing protein [Acidimicrobiales bacterium]